jgi:predicted lipoprotein with Yx(FWY)xxD motif
MTFSSLFAIGVSIAALAATDVQAQTTTSGGLLRDAAGKTLYIFDKDSAGESRCFDACAAAWPPFMASDAAKPAGRLSLLPRKGGGQQWAIDGRPLYHFAGDKTPGDTQGDGSGGVWHAVKADETAPRKAAAAAPDPFKY